MNKLLLAIIIALICISCYRPVSSDPGRDDLRVTSVYAARSGEIKLEVAPPNKGFTISREPTWIEDPVRSAYGNYTDIEVRNGQSYTYTLKTSGITKVVIVHK